MPVFRAVFEDWAASEGIWAAIFNFWGAGNAFGRFALLQAIG